MRNIRSICVAASLSLVSVAALLASGCGEEAKSNEEFTALVRKMAKPDINGFLIDKLKSHRVVMVGDFHHGSYLFSGTIINVLNAWLDSLETNGAASEVPREIILVLEKSPERLERLRRFWQTGEVGDLLGGAGIVSDNFSIETLEFYQDLRLVFDRVANWNADCADDVRVSLELLGPEEEWDYENATGDERQEYWLHERDEYSSSRVIKELQDKPDAKALVFYGSMHLQYGLVSKDLSGRHPADSGYFFAHYLNEADLEGGVYRVEQYSADQQAAYGSLRVFEPEPYAVDREALNALGDGYAARMGLRYESGIWYPYPCEPIKILPRTWSAHLAELAVEAMSVEAEKKAESSQADAYMNDMYLRLLTGKPLRFHNVCAINWMRWKSDDGPMGQMQADAAEWRLSLAERPIRAVDDIVSLAIWRRQIANMRQETDKNLLGLYAFAVDYELWTGYGRMRIEADVVDEIAETFDAVLTADSVRIVTSNLIALLWVGDEQERTEAREVLQKMTGQGFETPKEWSVWWRESGPEFLRVSDSLGMVL